MEKADFIGKKVIDFIDGDFISNRNPEDYGEENRKSFTEDTGYGYFHFVNREISKWDASKVNECEKETFILGGENDFALVVEGKVEAILYEYEGVNAFIHYPILVIPGHDAVTTYNLETKKYMRNHIR